MANEIKPVRRVVTGNDAQGRSKVLYDSAAPNVKPKAVQATASGLSDMPPHIPKDYQPPRCCASKGTGRRRSFPIVVHPECLALLIVSPQERLPRVLCTRRPVCRAFRPVKHPS